MIVFKYNMKRILNKKKGIISMMFITFIILILSRYLTTDSSIPRISVIDNDKTKVTYELIRKLSETYELKNANGKDIADDLSDLSTEKLQYVLVIDKGFTNNIINGKTPSVNSYYDKNNTIHTVIDEDVNSYIGDLKSMAVKSSESEFYNNFNRYEKSSYKVNYIQFENKNKKYAAIGLHFFVMLMLFSSISLANGLIISKHEAKSFRTFAGPITLKNYMFQGILSLFVLTLFQVVVILGVLTIIYGTVMLKYTPLLFVAFSAFSLTSVSIGVFVKYLYNYKSNGHTYISTLIVIPMCMLGGCFWDNSMMPTAFRYAANFVPNTWIITAIDNILFYNGSLASIGIDIIVLILFSIVFFLLGIFTKRDVVK